MDCKSLIACNLLKKLRNDELNTSRVSWKEETENITVESLFEMIKMDIGFE